MQYIAIRMIKIAKCIDYVLKLLKITLITTVKNNSPDEDYRTINNCTFKFKCSGSLIFTSLTSRYTCFKTISTILVSSILVCIMYVVYFDLVTFKLLTNKCGSFPFVHPPPLSPVQLTHNPTNPLVTLRQSLRR